jgi:hypothetical protein
MVAGGRRWRRSGFSRGCGGWRRGGLPRGAKMLTGMHGVLRIRVAGDYRVLYTVDDDRLVVLVVDVGHRRPIHRANWPGGHKVLAPPSGGRHVAAKCARRLTLARPAGTMRRGIV